MRLKLLYGLFVSFFKIGLISFGGGYAVIPLLQLEAVERRKWLSKEELLDTIAISQAFPGIIIVNSSTMIGYRVCGFWGSLVATTATLIPSFCLILVITAFFWKYTENIYVRKAFSGILIGVTSLIIYSMTKMWKSSIKGYFDIFLALVSTSALLLFKLNAVIVILLVLAVGFVYNLRAAMKGGGNN
jgi:chromate transporter